MSSELSERHFQEVTDVVRDSIDQRVQQYAASLHNKRQPKHKKEMAPASAVSVKGNYSVASVKWITTHPGCLCLS